MDKLLTPAELAEKLGLAVQTVYNRRATGGSLPRAMMIGSRVRFRLEDVEHWLTCQYESFPTQKLAGGQHDEISQRVDETPRRVGRPTKAEQVRRRKLGRR
jgi:excisionase family DNA binding protein